MNQTALFVFGFEGQFNFKNRTGIIFKTANDRGVDANAIYAVPSLPNKSANLLKFVPAINCGIRFGRQIRSIKGTFLRNEKRILIDILRSKKIASLTGSYIARSFNSHL